MIRVTHMNEAGHSGRLRAAGYALSIPQKSPVYSAKEPCLFHKRALSIPQSPVYSAKEPCLFRKRAHSIPQKSPVYSAKEPSLFRKRALYIPQKSPVYSAKELCLYSDNLNLLLVLRRCVGRALLRNG